MNYWTQSENNIFVAAHRGWMAKYPENTMESFKAALDIGVDQIETDVRVSKDGELILLHDAEVDRTTNGTGSVYDMTYDEIRALSAHAGKGEEFKHCYIPTLKELMELVKDHPTITLDIELKVGPVEGKEELAYSVCDRTLKMLEEYGFKERCVINAFDGRLHTYVHKKYGGSWKLHGYYPKTAFIEEGEIDPYTIDYCVCMFSPVRGFCMAPKVDFEEMRAKGVRTWAGAGVKDADAVDQAIECGVELITCNNPDEILAFLRERGYHK